VTIPSGAYSVTVTDANGCTVQVIDTVTQPQSPLSLSSIQLNVLCHGNATGNINLTPTGGTAPYLYLWSDGSTLQDPQNLLAGTYSVTVTDANGCTAQLIDTVTQPQSPLSLSSIQLNVLCHGANTGSINLTPTGGTAPYLYLWSNGSTLQDRVTAAHYKTHKP